MNEYLAAAIEEKQQAFDANLDADAPDGLRVFLLERSINSSDYNALAEVENGYFVKFNNFREQMQFEFATVDAGFTDVFTAAAAIGYGVPDADNEIDVFSIAGRDKIPPNGTSPTYKCFGIRSDTERYAIA